MQISSRLNRSLICAGSSWHKAVVNGTYPLSETPSSAPLLVYRILLFLEKLLLVVSFSQLSKRTPDGFGPCVGLLEPLLLLFARVSVWVAFPCDGPEFLPVPLELTGDFTVTRHPVASEEGTVSLRVIEIVALPRFGERDIYPVLAPCHLQACPRGLGTKERDFVLFGGCESDPRGAQNQSNMKGVTTKV